MYQFLSDYGASSPQNAPNWENMWSKEHTTQRQFPQNKSFDPVFTK
jgi:hypothetical protein